MNDDRANKIMAPIFRLVPSGLWNRLYEAVMTLDDQTAHNLVGEVKKWAGVKNITCPFCDRIYYGDRPTCGNLGCIAQWRLKQRETL